MSTVSVATILSTSSFMDRDTMSPTSSADVYEDSTSTRSPTSSPEFDEDSRSMRSTVSNTASVGEDGSMPPYSAWYDIYRWRCSGTNSGELPTNDTARISTFVSSESENGDSRVSEARRFGRWPKTRRPKKIGLAYLMSI